MQFHVSIAGRKKGELKSAVIRLMVVIATTTETAK